MVVCVHIPTAKMRIVGKEKDREGITFRCSFHVLVFGCSRNSPLFSFLSLLLPSEFGVLAGIKLFWRSLIDDPIKPAQLGL